VEIRYLEPWFPANTGHPVDGVPAIAAQLEDVSEGN
jgi:hypothetical protein